MKLGESFDVVAAVRALAQDSQALREVAELLERRVATLEARSRAGDAKAEAGAQAPVGEQPPAASPAAAAAAGGKAKVVK